MGAEMRDEMKNTVLTFANAKKNGTKVTMLTA